MTVLNVAEKNDAAKSIAGFLSRNSSIKKEGKSKYNKIYEFGFNYAGTDCQMMMTSVSGHLMNYAFAADKKNWHSTNPLDLFDSPIYKICPENSLDVKKSLEILARKAQHLIIWTDCDREGENIGMEIANVCKSVNRNIVVKRAKFSEITMQSVTRAMNNLVEIDSLQSEAVDVRQELDLKTGAAFTRLQTMRLQNMFPQSLSNRLVSYGSCQFPTVGFVVDRFKVIEGFQSEPFWKIVLEHKKSEDDKIVEFYWDRQKLFDHETVVSLFDNINDDYGPLGCVISIQSKPKSKWRPLAMDTVELEKLGSRKLKINAKETMSIAEKLYSKGYISYPRTETNIFPKEINLINLVNTQRLDNRWADFVDGIMQNGVNPRNGKKSDKAHPPIHPLKLGNDLSGKEASIFELITRHFLACLSKNAEGHETKILVDCINGVNGVNAWDLNTTSPEISGVGELFHVTGLTVIERNYLAVYPYEKWSDRELPEYRVSEILQPPLLQIKIDQSQTTAPCLLTEADLISLMDKHGIGTDATHAEHIDKVKTRQYIGCTGANDKFLIPGQLGMGLVDGYELMGFNLTQPDLRADFEKDLSCICSGEKQGKDVLEYYLGKYKEIFINTKRQINKLDEGISKYLQETPTAHQYLASTDPTNMLVRNCPTCSSGSVNIRKTRTDKWMLGCSSFPCCKHSIWLVDRGCIQIQSVSIARDLNSQLIICNGLHNNTNNKPVHKISIKLSSNQQVLGNELINPDDGSFHVCLYCNQTVCDALELDLRHNSSSLPSSVIPRINRSHNIASTTNVNTIHTANIIPQVPEQQILNNLQSKLCHCKLECSKKKVVKESANTGRYFFSCDKGVCKYFEWADEPSSNMSKTFNKFPNTTQVTSEYGDNYPCYTNVTNNSGAVKCECGTIPKIYTVKKDNKNKGREFYSCQICSYFKWADESSSNSVGAFDKKKNFKSKPNLPKFDGSEFAVPIGTKRCYTSTENMWPPVSKQSKMTTNVNKTNRRCSKCRMPGHTVNRCPQNNN